MAITAVMIDSREPDWVKKLTFGGVPTAVHLLDYGDLHAVCEDGTTIIVERKTPDDFLNSLKSGRLFPQLTPMWYETKWSYLIITDEFQRGAGDKAITGRGITGWSWTAVQGAILSVQEMGVMVVFCAGDSDYEAAVLRLGNRNHDDDVIYMPPRFPRILTAQETLIASLPGIGIERLSTVMEFSGNNPSVALQMLTDPDLDIPDFPNGIKHKIRKALGLEGNENIFMEKNVNGKNILSIEKNN